MTSSKLNQTRQPDVLSVIPLRVHFKKNSNEYRLRCRNEHVALYEVRNRVGLRVAIEVIPVIVKRPDRYHPTAYEYFPSDEEFSKRGEKSFIMKNMITRAFKYYRERIEI